MEKEVERLGQTMICELLQSDPMRMKILRLVRERNLPDCWVAAGFVRNMIWDHLHSGQQSALSDIDVIYFDPDDPESEAGMAAEKRLTTLEPRQNWQVRNQAVMHLRNGHSPYASSADAMTYWPEIETAIAVRMASDGSIDLCAPFGVESLCQGLITQNPRSTTAILNERLREKGWMQKWPCLRIAAQQGGQPDAFGAGYL